MVNYESLLMGGEMDTQMMKMAGGKMTYEERCANLAKAREARKMKGGKKCCTGCKKGCSSCKQMMKMSGGKMTYEDRCANLAKAREARKNKKKGGEQWNQDYIGESQVNYAGSPLDLYYEMPEKQEKLLKEQRGEIGKGMKRGKGVKGVKDLKTQSMKFMKESMHTGLDMPTEKQFKTGGKMKKASKSNEYQVDLDGAIEHLGQLASMFGLRLV